MHLARILLLAAVITGSWHFHALAAEDVTTNTHGLDRIMSPAGVQGIQVAPMVVGHKTIYAADLYGDGLVRFAISNPPAAGDDQALSVNQISDAIGEVATGGVPQATTYHNQNEAIIIEPVASAGATNDTLGSANSAPSLYHRPWQQPMRIALKKPKFIRPAPNSAAPLQHRPH